MAPQDVAATATYHEEIGWEATATERIIDIERFEVLHAGSLELVRLGQIRTK